MNECVYLSLKHNFYNEIQLDSTQVCNIEWTFQVTLVIIIVFPIVEITVYRISSSKSKSEAGFQPTVSYNVAI